MTARSLIGTLDAWCATLQTAASMHPNLFTDVSVSMEVDSTQDELRRVGGLPGAIVTALRQTAGRGRHGRTWADTGALGTATSFAFQVAESRAAPLLALAAAVAAADAVESFLPAGISAGIKWPNDVIVSGRKIGGVLVEVRDRVALVGIGINVLHCAGDWPDELVNRAISLTQAGASDPDRLDVVSTLIDCMGRAASAPERGLVAEFARRDVLRGTSARIRVGSEAIEGTIIEIDPLRHLLVRVVGGATRRIAADRATIESARGSRVQFGD